MKRFKEHLQQLEKIIQAIESFELRKEVSQDCFETFPEFMQDEYKKEIEIYDMCIARMKQRLEKKYKEYKF